MPITKHTTKLQDLLLRVYTLAGSMDSYDHFGHGFHFFDQEVMDEMAAESLTVRDELEKLLATHQSEDPSRIHDWVDHNLELLQRRLDSLEADKGPDKGEVRKLHKKECRQLMKQWEEQRRADKLAIDVTCYWGLHVEGFSKEL